ncbi:DUF5723 family protein [Robiginitalea sp. SC105]|uniref:DUF5723 family protein n=1 Tax=Robiginitalea sp. SC105 TaxID=2762332 RepID=UPI00163A4723|nr:DUF5723 family protein [Robiginitalea sp. SC105]MBC2839606.1 hypothetical protein [Robiginitalea sp. SC105]
MKGLRMAALFCIACTGLMPGQNRQLLYDFTEIPQALLVNPGAVAGYQWYAGVPLLSGISVQAGSSGISVDDLFANDGLDINDKVRDRAVYGMDTRDEFSTTYQVELLSGGFRSRSRPSDFYSFGIYHEWDMILYWPRDLAILAWEGNADQLGRRFNLGHLKTRGELLNVFHFGVNRQVDNRWTLGARAKIYSGILHYRSSRNTGYFLTEEGENNLVANSIDADMRLQTSGFEGLRQILDDDTADQFPALRSHLVRRGFFGGDLGVGLDLGFTYSLTNRLVVTGSLLDLGLMVYHTDTRNFSLRGAATVEGVEVILPEALADPDRDFWQDLVDEVEALVPFEEDSRAFVGFRPTKLYGSIRYNWGQPQSGPVPEPCDCDYRTGGAAGRQISGYRNAVGAQLFAINRPRGPQAALTAFYLRRVGNWLALKATYTADKFTLSNLGLGMQFQAGPVQAYLLADNLLGYRNLAGSRYASFQFGLNILSWKRN